jgi:HK97 family phage portal protein
MNLLARATRPRRPDTSLRYTLENWYQDLTKAIYQGLTYGTTTIPPAKGEPIGNNFEGYVRGAYQRDGVVFACILARLLVYSEARFQWQRLIAGRPGDLYGTAELGMLERPWPGGTTGELLARMEQDASLAGNAFIARRADGTLARLHPDRVTIVHGSPNGPMGAPDDDPDAQVVGYLYKPGGPTSRAPIREYPVEQVAHYSPIPDPNARWRGMSWLTPVLLEVDSDIAATTHKLRFFENGATPNMVVKLPPAITNSAQFQEFKEMIDAGHSGLANAYKTLYLSAGADMTVVGSTFEQMSFKATQGAGETRIAAAAGVPPVIVGLSEGLQAATYSNYGQARRRFADGTLRPLWRTTAGSLETIVPPPAGTRLWYDDRDIAFLRDDATDAAQILKEQMLTVESGVRAGFTPTTVVAAVTAGDLSLLQHTGLFSVQLQPPNPAELEPSSE